MSKLNPQIRTIEVGRKTVREVTIYPLSMADQFRTTDLITELVSKSLEFLETPKTLKENQIPDLTKIKQIVGAIETNLDQILGFIVDSGENIDLEDFTNLQFSELADLIFEVNYAGAMGNFQGLITKIKILLPSMGPSQSLSPKQATDLNTSSLEALGTEE